MKTVIVSDIKPT